MEALRNKQSLVPSKHGRGGQSAHRFERLIEHAAHDFFVRCGEMANELFLPKKDQLKGILIGGPGATKEYFYKENYLHYELQQKVVLPLFDVGYTDEYGLKEMVEKATQTLHGLELTEEKRIIQRLLNEIRRAETGLAAYGEKDVQTALEGGAVEILLISEGLRKKRVAFRCSSCGNAFDRTLTDAQVDEVLASPCPKCGTSALTVTESEVCSRTAVPSSAEIRGDGTDDLDGERRRRDAGQSLRRRRGDPAVSARHARSPAPSGHVVRRTCRRDVLYQRLPSGSGSGSFSGSAGRRGSAGIAVRGAPIG